MNPRRLGCVLAALVMLAACKDPPKPVKDETPKSSPVPSDMVFNDFLPSGGGGGNLAVRMDGGLEAGLAAAGGGDGGGAGAGAAGDAANGAAKLLEPGAEPRAARHYAFTPNKVEKRTLTLRSSLSAQGQKQDLPGLTLFCDIAAKAVTPKGAKMEVKLTKAELADQDKLPPQLIQQAQKELSVFSGLTASFDVTPLGGVGEVSIGGSEKMQKQGAEELLQAVSQIAELILAPLPAEPIGVGAKWEIEEGGEGSAGKGKRTLELKEAPDGGPATIVATMERKIPKRQHPDPRLRGATVEGDAKGTFTYTQRFDRPANKVQSEMTQTEKIEAPANEKGEKRSAVREMKVKHVLDTPTK